MDLGLQFISGMPPIWKILFFAALCLGLGPIYGNDAIQENMDPVISEILDTEFSASEAIDSSEVISSEMVPDSELEPVAGLRKQESLKDNQPFKEADQKKDVIAPGVETYSKKELDNLNQLGIKKLPPGISIFRYNHHQIKNKISFLKERTHTEKTVQ